MQIYCKDKNYYFHPCRIGRDPINEAAAVLTKEKAEQGATLRIKVILVYFTIQINYVDC